MKQVNKFVYEIRSAGHSADEFKFGPVPSGFTACILLQHGKPRFVPGLTY